MAPPTGDATGAGSSASQRHLEPPVKSSSSQSYASGTSTPAATDAVSLPSQDVILSQNEEKNMQPTSSSVGGDAFQVRKLEIADKHKGFIELLQQLTVCGSISEEAFERRFHELSRYGDDHIICVIEDCNSGRIVGTGSVFLEKKFIRNCGKVGHIEDVVVDSGVRGKQLGKKIVGFLSDHAREMGCYKVILDCSVENSAFYKRCGFMQKEVQMVKYFI